MRECSELVAYLDRKMLLINEEIQNYSSNQVKNYGIEDKYNSEIVESLGTIVDEGNSKRIKEKEKETKRPVEIGCFRFEHKKVLHLF